jgi:excisionase family DNA binding protein
MKKLSERGTVAVTTQEAADHCQVSLPTFKRWIDGGSLAAFRTPGGHRRILLDEFQRFLSAEGMPPYPEPGDEATGQRILVADDNPGTVAVLLDALSDDPRGFELASATDGFDALVKVGAFKPTVLVLDVLMPGLDGIEVCRRLRAGGETARIRILGITGQPTLIPELFAAGADACLAKPWRLEELRSELDRLLALAADTARRPGAAR